MREILENNYDGVFIVKFIINFDCINFSIFMCICGTWSHHSGNNNSYSRDAGYCKALARSQFSRIHLQKSVDVCSLDETNKVLDQIIQSNATFNKCMYQKGYDK